MCNSLLAAAAVSTGVLLPAATLAQTTEPGTAARPGPSRQVASPGSAAPQASRPAQPRSGRDMSAAAATIPDYVANPNKEDLNHWTVGVAGGLLEGTFIRYAADLAKALDDGTKLRVIPQVTFGAVGNVTDLLSLRGVDAAITQSDALDYFRNVQKIHNIADRVHYVSTLYNAEVHVYARQEYGTLRDLEGKKVAFNTPGSAANLTGLIVFGRLGIKVEPQLVNNAAAIEQMRSGEIAAVVHVVGKPNELFARYKPEPGFHFIPVPYDQAFRDYYTPARIEATDYPNLMPAGTSVETIAVPAVLAVYNWPKDSDRARRVERFVNAYFDNFDRLKGPGFQPKWKTISLTATVPGWTRYRVAEDALRRVVARGNQLSPDRMKSEFAAFLAASGSTRTDPARGGQADEEALFKRFLEWRQSR